MGIYLGRALVISGITLLAGCASTGGSDTQPRQPSDFSDVEVRMTDLDDGFLRKGRFTSPANISRVTPGTSSATVLELLGSPDEGMGERWWFYNVNLPLDGIKDYLVCQFKVTFNAQQQVSSSEWRRPQCRDRYNALQVPDVQELALSSDVLFAFDSASLKPAGQRELDVVARVASDEIKLVSIAVVGHTDRIGSDGYNLALSMQRAEAVRHYLVSKGVPGRLITAEGRGASEPLVTCEGRQVSDSLKNCLQPNRRVHITIQGLR